MELMFEIISRQKFTARCEVSYIFGKAGGYIGRSNECEWILPDKSKQISRKHALISCDGENFYIEDISTNGILTVVDKQPLPKNTRVPIEHGTSYYIGEYTIQARLIHKPDAYISSAESMEATDLIPEDAYLDLDPLVAMDQQEEFEAKRRMGLYNDLLGTTSVQQQVLQNDHSEPPLDSMPEVKAIPEDWNAMDDTTTMPGRNADASRLQHLLTQDNSMFPQTEWHNAAGADTFTNSPQSGFSPSQKNSNTIPLTTDLLKPWPSDQSTIGSNQLPHSQSAPPQPPQGQPPSHRVHQRGTAAWQAHPVHSEYTILQAAALAEAPPREVEKVQETDAFFKTLGFRETPENPEERERLLTEAAEMLLASIDGLLQILRNRADSKNDLRLPLTTMTLASNNPLKYSPSALVALEHMLSPHKEGMLSPSQAIVASFSDIHSHHMGILAGARAAVGAALHKISPEKVESKLDAETPRRFNKAGKLWNTYTRMHRAILNDPDSFADFFLHDFARAYEMQVRTLHPLPGRNKGE